MNKKYRLKYLMFLLILGFTSHSYANQVLLKVAAVDWCPHICLAKDQPGYLVETLKTIFKNSPYNIEIDILPWSRAIKEVTEGKYQMLLGSTKKEAPELLYPQTSLSEQQMCFFTKTENQWVYSSIDSLHGHQVGIAENVSVGHLNEIINVYPNLFQFQPYHERFIKQNIGKLLKNRIDSFIFSYQSTMKKIREMGLTDKVRLAGCVEKEKVYVAFSSVKDQKIDPITLINFTDAKLEELNKTKKLDGIYNTYFQ